MNLTTNELINLKYMMKVISIATWLMLLILAGCGDASPYAEEPSAQERTITLNLDITTRAETGENPDNFHLWIFNGDKLLTYINSNPSWEEVNNGKVDLKATVEAEIDATEVNAIQFYLLLNTNVTGPWGMTPDKLKDLTFTLPEQQPYSHDNKVPMSCDTTLNIFPSQIHYDVEMNAVRCVGKLEVYCTKNLSSTSLSLNKITLGHEPDKGYFWETSDPNYITYNKERILFEPQNGQEITTVLTSEDLPHNDKLEEVIKNFTPIDFSSSPYFLENQNGGDALQVEGVDETITDEDTRYYLTLNYTLDGSPVEKKIYLTKIDRNTLNKVFIRIKEKVFDIEVSYSVKPWDLVVLTPEF